ncbi:DUF2147 domain-containing protein [Runella sp. CRIBMP]|uniref:DUF2147 domain-containing protein n=1 Tax=Runella sp. CRIBMP TaxID=2683261 RepID=UPI001411C06E|nr:DUF2147 domain-containing protein [Runella sp. CRIBMP]NBB22867.1 DUF2147 domain-containing protein [Runella sp. CRIBMP]
MQNLPKIMLKAALLLFISAYTSMAQNADAVLGVWKNGEGTGMVQIYKKADKYYGKIVWLKVVNDPDGTPRKDINNPDEKLRPRPLKGLENLRDFVFKGENKWEEGRIYDPKTGNDYACEMTMVDENTLEVRGFIGVSLFGRTDVWKRQVKKS